MHVLVVEDNEADLLLIGEALDTAKLDVALHFIKDGEQAVLFFDQLDAEGALDQLDAEGGLDQLDAEGGLPSAARSDPAVVVPDLIILDISLPKKQGGDVLKHIRNSKRCSAAPVLVVSTSAAPRDRELMFSLGANAYFTKPSDFDEFMQVGDVVRALLSGISPGRA